MFLLHATLATLTLAIGKLELQVTVYKTLLDFNGSADDGWELRPVYAKEGKVPLTALVATLFLLTATFPLATAALALAAPAAARGAAAAHVV